MTACIITSSLLITAIIALRFLFRGTISRRMQYALWGLVLLRLLMPFPLFESPLSIMNLLPDPLPAMEVPAGERPEPIAGTENHPDGPVSDRRAAEPVYGGTSIPLLLRTIWITGSIAAGLWILTLNAVLYHRLQKTRRAYEAGPWKLPVYVSEAIASPCLFGLLRPAIYLTPNAIENKESMHHVLMHELCHFRQGDHIWLILRNVCLAVYWWNPLVWAAALLSRMDSELACDEAVIKQIGAEHALAYGRTLVDMIAMKRSPSGIMYAAATMVSNQRSLRKRLNMIIKHPKAAFPAMIAVFLVILICLGCTFTGAQAEPLSPEEALEALAASTFHTKQEVSFQIPARYEHPEEWNIHIAGRMETDGFSRSVHLFDDINAAKAWKPGARYRIALSDSYTELTLSAYLPDGSGGTLEKEWDLLSSPALTTSYGLIHLQYGTAYRALSPLSGDQTKLAENLIFDYLVKSAAWPSGDLTVLQDCYLLRATNSDGTKTDYYAYLLDGMPVMQAGIDGRYSRIDDELYQQLVQLANNNR